MEKLSGIYQIRNLINNKIYIGKSKSLKSRLSVHLSELRNNKHHSYHLQRSVNKYGIENFEYSILQYCNIEDLTFLEENYIQSFDSTNRIKGYNILKSEELSKIQSDNANIRNLKFGNLNKARLKSIESRKVKIFQYSINGIFLKEWSSIKQAADELNLDASTITKNCKGKVRYIKDFVFSYNKSFNFRGHKQRTSIEIKNLSTNTYMWYPSITLFCKDFGIADTSVIHNSLKNRDGKYKNFLIKKI